MNHNYIKELRARTDYHIMVAILGDYDDKKDYMGAGDGLGNRLVPRTLWGIDCNVAAYIHDYRYFVGGNELDRRAADIEFYQNLLYFIEDHECHWPWGSQWLHNKLARRRAEKYYLAVKNFGEGSFNYHDN